MTRTHSTLARTRGTLVAGAAVLAAVLAGCGGTGGGAPEPDTTTAPASALADGSVGASPDGGAPSDGGDTDGDGDGGDGGDGDGDGGDGGAGPPDGGGGPAAGGCGTGEFAVGVWSRVGPGDGATVSGISASGSDDCARLHIAFDGPIPGLQVTRTPLGNDTIVSLEGGIPTGPVAGDLITPDMPLLTAAFVTAHGDGVGVRILHGDHREVAARAVPADGGIAVSFRPLRPDDTRHEPVVGRSRDVSLGGQPADGLVVLEARGEASTGHVVVEGYAQAPESHVVMRVSDTGGGEVCTDSGLAHGPPYLFSRFTRSCPAGAGSYEVEAGFPDPSGGPGVWSHHDVTVE